MKFSSLFACAVVTTAAFLCIGTTAHAAALPLGGVSISVKSLQTKRVIEIYTDSNGFFKTDVPEKLGFFNIFVADESTIPVMVPARNGVVSGRVVVLTDGTTTKEPDPVPVKKVPALIAPLKKTAKS